MENIKEIYRQVDNATVLIAEISRSSRELVAGELEAVKDAVPSRKKEFAAGREIALIALAKIGFHESSLPVSQQRFPVWPNGVVGSISHTSTMVGVAVAPRSHYSSIGFDLEIEGAVDPELCSVILSESEKQAADESPAADFATTIFGCKEAVYKAVNPITSEYFDFLDVRITITQNTFIAECIADIQSASIINSGTGFIEFTDGLAASLFLLE